MLVSTEIIVENNPANRYYCKEAIIKEVEDKLILNVLKLPKNSKKKVLVQCDYCGAMLEVKYCDYNRVMDRNLVGKYACVHCGRTIKNKEQLNAKYGVSNCSQLVFVKEKKKSTTKEHFGCDYPMQSLEVQSKSRATMKNKYGVEHNLQREEIKLIVKEANSHRKYENNSAPSSKAQRKISELMNGKLNFPVGCYNLDILLDENIYVEYNGSGHDLIVKLGNISKEEFTVKEIKRYQFLKEQGYKEIIIENKSDVLPNDDVIIDTINWCKNLLILYDLNWIKIDFDANIISTKNSEYTLQDKLL